MTSRGSFIHSPPPNVPRLTLPTGSSSDSSPISIIATRLPGAPGIICSSSEQIPSPSKFSDAFSSTSVASQSGHPSVPPLKLPSHRAQNNLFETLTARFPSPLSSSRTVKASPISPEKDGEMLPSSERRRRCVAARTASYAPLPLPSLFEHAGIKRSVTTLTAHALSDSGNEKFERKELRGIITQASRDLNGFACIVDDRVTSDGAILVVSQKTGLPSWREVSRMPHRERHYQERTEAALWLLARSVQMLVDRNVTYFRITNPKDGKRKRASLLYISGIFFLNEHARLAINHNHLLRQKIVGCYLRTRVFTIHAKCIAMCQALNDLTKYTMWKHLESLRRTAHDRHMRIFSQSVENPLEFHGYQNVFQNASMQDREKYTMSLRLTPEQLLTYDGQEIHSAISVFTKCRAIASETIERIDAALGMIPAQIERGETLEFRYNRSLQLARVEKAIANFENGYRGFIGSTLLFLEKHYGQELEKTRYNSEKYHRRLENGLANSYCWRDLLELLYLINYVVTKVVNEDNVTSTSL